MWPFRGGEPSPVDPSVFKTQGPGPNDRVNPDGTRSSIDSIADSAQDAQQRQTAVDQQREDENQVYIESARRRPSEDMREEINIPTFLRQGDNNEHREPTEPVVRSEEDLEVPTFLRQGDSGNTEHAEPAEPVVKPEEDLELPAFLRHREDGPTEEPDVVSPAESTVSPTEPLAPSPETSSTSAEPAAASAEVEEIEKRRAQFLPYNQEEVAARAEVNRENYKLEQRIQQIRERDPSLTEEQAMSIAALGVISEKAEANMQQQFQELRNSRWDRLCQDHPTLKKITRFVSALLGGGAISIGVKMAVLTVAGTAVVPAAIIGGAVAGGIIGYKMAKSREHEHQYGAKTLNQELKLDQVSLSAKEGEKGYISSEELYKKIELAKKLVETRRVLGQRAEIEDLLVKIKDMQVAYDSRRLEKIVNEQDIFTEEELRQAVAEGLIRVQKDKLAAGEVFDEDKIEKFNQRIIEQKEQAKGKASFKGAVVGAVLGGALSGLVAHFTAVQGYGGGHYNPEAAAHYAASNESFNHLVQQIQHGDITNAVQEAAKNGIDLTRTVSIGGQESRLVDVLQAMAQKGGVDLQTFYNMMSYPDQISSICNSIAQGAGASATPESIISQLYTAYSDPSLLHQYSSVINHHGDVLLNAARLSYLGSPVMSAASKVGIATALAGSTAVAIGSSFGKEKTPQQIEEDKTRKLKIEEDKKKEREKAKEEKELRDLNSKVNKGFEELEKSLQEAGDNVSNEIRERITHYIADMRPKLKTLEDLKFIDEQIKRDQKLIKDSIAHNTATPVAPTLVAPPGRFDDRAPSAPEEAETATPVTPPVAPPEPGAAEPEPTEETKTVNDFTFPQRIKEVMEQQNYDTEPITPENIDDLTNIISDHAGKLFVEIGDDIFILFRDGKGGYYLRRDPKPDDDPQTIKRREGRVYYEESISGKQLIERGAERVIELLFEEE